MLKSIAGTLLRVLCIACTLTSACASAQSSTSSSQWLSYNNRLDGQRYSTLKQITPANAAQLGEVCRVQIDGPTAFTAGLVVIDGVIYTNTGNETVALDAATCAVRWKHTYVHEDDETGISNRGVAVMDGRIFRGTGDARLLALDAATGKMLWKNVIGSPRLGESTSAAPLAWNGVVYMGIGGSELGIRGRVMAYDAQTGRELWRFDTIPMHGEKGSETWKRARSAKTGGGGVWGTMSLDVATGELFVPVGNPWPDLDPGYRPGDNLFTNSIVVLDARTGALRWWHQVTPSDWQDLDLSAGPVLYRDGNTRDLAAFAGKDGFVTAVDRDTRKPIFRTPVTRIDNADTKPSPAGVRVCPGPSGGVLWNGPTLDRLNNALIAGSIDSCFVLKQGTASSYPTGQVTFGGTFEQVVSSTGWVTALDSETGEVRWKYHAEKPVVAGITPTAGGVTFTGDLAGHLLVFDSKTGALLHKVQTGGALAGGVVTYEMGGKQYLAFASGNVSRTAFGALGLPSVVIMALNAGNTAAPRSQQTSSNAPAGEADIERGRRLYGQICVSCHGADGNMLADHKLSDLGTRRDRAATVAYIKDPKLPMPKMYPDLLNEQNVVDVAAYVLQDLGKR